MSQYPSFLKSSACWYNPLPLPPTPSGIPSSQPQLLLQIAHLSLSSSISLSPSSSSCRLISSNSRSDSSFSPVIRSVVACSSCTKAQPAHGHAACQWLIQWLPAPSAGHNMSHTQLHAVWLLVTVQSIDAGHSTKECCQSTSRWLPDRACAPSVLAPNLSSCPKCAANEYQGAPAPLNGKVPHTRMIKGGPDPAPPCFCITPPQSHRCAKPQSPPTAVVHF